MGTSFYTQQEVEALGFKCVGKHVLLSKKTSLYGISHISIGDNSRIDDFCILSGQITIGKHVHIAAYCALFAGKTGIELGDFSGLSSRVSIYAESDDYSGESLTNPTISDVYKKIQTGKVIIKQHGIVGASSVLLPGSVLPEGTAVGAQSLVTQTLDSWGIYAGSPVRKLKPRKQGLLAQEALFLQNI